MGDLLAPDLCRVAISNVVWDPLAPDLYRVAISNVVWDPLAPDLCRVGRAVRSEIRPLELGAAVGIGGSDWKGKNSVAQQEYKFKSPDHCSTPSDYSWNHQIIFHQIIIGNHQIIFKTAI